MKSNELETKLGKSKSWVFKLHINNHTNRDLYWRDEHLSWGHWLSGPGHIPAHSHGLAVAVSAASGSATGYEFSCTWYLGNDGTQKIATMTLSVDVPYSKKNSSSLKARGFLRVEGWESLPCYGHNFQRTIDVYEVGNIKSSPVVDEEITDPVYEEYMNLLSFNSDMIKHWAELKKMKEMDQFDILEYIPEKYLYPPKSTFICRSGPHPIAKNHWGQINDPDFPMFFQKDALVEEYFAVAVHSINTDPRSTHSIPKNVTLELEKIVEVTSSIKNVLSTSQSIRSLVKGQTGNEKSYVALELESIFSISNVLEESHCEFKRKTEKIILDKSDKNRLFVPWVFSTALAIYRKRETGLIELLGVSEWGIKLINKVYDYE